MTDRCGYPGCGVRRPHLAHMIPSEIPPHEWEQPRPIIPATRAAIAAARPSSFKPRQESNHA